MAFRAGGTDYGGFLRQRAQADEGVTRAMERKARADKQARIKKSGQRSGLQKLASTALRAGAAYYTGGLSEQMGAGEMIDEVALGTDSEGMAVRNEYGGLVKAGSAIYQGSKAQKAGKLGEQDAKFDKLMDRRQKNVKTLFDAGMKTEGMEAQSAMEDMRLKYDANRKEAEGKGWGGSMLGMSDEDMSIQPAAMTPEQRAAKVQQLNIGGDTSAITGEQDAGGSPFQMAKQPDEVDEGGSPFQIAKQQVPPSAVPAKPDAPQIPTSFGVPDASRGVQPVSAAEIVTSPSSRYKLQGDERKREQDELIERITGSSGGKSDQDLQQERAIRSWTSNMTDVNDPNLRIMENWKKQQLRNSGAQ